MPLSDPIYMETICYGFLVKTLLPISCHSPHVKLKSQKNFCDFLAFFEWIPCILSHIFIYINTWHKATHYYYI